ncbi:hypothetical protein, partial [Streptomyces alkaliterrae]|uniref:hypothetical protein n=1 Tax=Streptomyces alkaliterrae TaxID=2213162 RepID=UPI001E3C5238
SPAPTDGPPSRSASGPARPPLFRLPSPRPSRGARGGSGSVFGFTTVWGRGYRPAQVDERTAALLAERERLEVQESRLVVLVRQLAEEARRLGRAVAALREPSFEPLGARARLVVRLAVEEADELCGRAAADARTLRGGARSAGTRLREDADRAAAEIRRAADAEAEATLAAAREEAARVLVRARADAARVEEEAAARLERARRECARLLAGQALRQRVAEHRLEGRLAVDEAAVLEVVARLEARGAALLAEAERALRLARRAAGRRLAEAEAQAAELLTEASARASHINRAAERDRRHERSPRRAVERDLARTRAVLEALTGRNAPPGAAGGAHGGVTPGDDRGPSAGILRVTSTRSRRAHP